MKFCSFPTLCEVQQQITVSAVVVFSPYTALQGITLNIVREDGNCIVEPGCQSDTVRFHSTSGWEYKHFLSDYQN